MHVLRGGPAAGVTAALGEHALRQPPEHERSRPPAASPEIDRGAGVGGETERLRLLSETPPRRTGLHAPSDLSSRGSHSATHRRGPAAMYPPYPDVACSRRCFG